jgi:DNA-binding response OmpR family regulator
MMVNSSSQGLVLVVEDEGAISDLIKLYLTRDGFGVQIENDGAQALDRIRQARPVAVILDIGLPGMSGTEICRQLRAEGDWTPILFVTAQDDEVDRILGLELGGDDYITKPFSPRELVARVRGVLRRGGVTSPGDILQVGAIQLDPTTHQVLVAGKHVELTTLEFDLLAYFMRSPGQVFSRDQLMAHVWGYGVAAGTRTVDVHVAQLRSKIGDSVTFRTVRGVGYALSDQVHP